MQSSRLFFDITGTMLSGMEENSFSIVCAPAETVPAASAKIYVIIRFIAFAKIQKSAQTGSVFPPKAKRKKRQGIS